MSYNAIRLQKCEVALQSVLGTAETTGFLNLACEPPTPPVGSTMYERPVSTGSFYRVAPIEGSKAGQELTLSIPVMHGVNAGIMSADPVAHPESLFFTSVLGGSNISHFESSAVSTSSTTSTAKIKAAVTSSDYDIGQGEIFEDANGDHWIGWITDITDGGGSDHDVDLFQAIPAAPAADTTTYGTITSYLGTGQPTFFTIRIGSQQANSRMVLEGCVPRTVNLSVETGGLARLEVTFWCNNVTASSGALTDYVYTYPTLPPSLGANAARCIINGSAVAIRNFQLNCEQTLAPVGDWNATSGVSAVPVTDRVVSVEYARVVTTSAPALAVTANQSHLFQIGSTPGNMFGVLMPSGVHMMPGELGDLEGLRSQSYRYEAGQYTADASSTAPGDTSFRVCFG